MVLKGIEGKARSRGAQQWTDRRRRPRRPGTDHGGCTSASRGAATSAIGRLLPNESACTPITESLNENSMMQGSPA